MAYFQFQDIALTGMSAAVPDQRVCVDEYIPIFGSEAVKKFSQVTHIREMYRALPEQTASDLGFSAARHLLEKKQMDPRSIDMLIFVTQSPDYSRPTSACVLHGRLGLRMDCPAIELNNGCSGYVYGVQMACAMLQCSQAERALLLLGDTASKLVNPKDKTIAMMFGDAGAAILMEKRSGAAVIQGCLNADGERFKSIILPAGGFRDREASRAPFRCADGCERTLYDLHMDGASVFSFSLTDVPQTIRNFVAHFGLDMATVDAYILHQANAFILQQIVRKLKIDQDQVPVTIDRYGNTGASSIPLTLCDAYAGQGRGTLDFLSCGFGVGLSWGVLHMRVDTADILPVIKTKDYYAEGRIAPDML